jgi:hypothetical protein
MAVTDTPARCNAIARRPLPAYASTTCAGANARTLDSTCVCNWSAIPAFTCTKLAASDNASAASTVGASGTAASASHTSRRPPRAGVHQMPRQRGTVRPNHAMSASRHCVPPSIASATLPSSRRRSVTCTSSNGAARPRPARDVTDAPRDGTWGWRVTGSRESPARTTDHADCSVGSARAHVTTSTTWSGSFAA